MLAIINVCCYPFLAVLAVISYLEDTKIRFSLLQCTTWLQKNKLQSSTPKISLLVSKNTGVIFLTRKCITAIFREMNVPDSHWIWFVTTYTFSFWVTKITLGIKVSIIHSIINFLILLHFLNPTKWPWYQQ